MYISFKNVFICQENQIWVIKRLKLSSPLFSKVDSDVNIYDVNFFESNFLIMAIIKVMVENRRKSYSSIQIEFYKSYIV